MSRLTIYTIFLLLINSLAFSDGLKVLNGDAHQQMMTSYLRNLTDEAFDCREAAYEELKTEEQLLEYQIRMKNFFIEQLGGFPERTPLNAQITGKLSFEDYRMEKIIYESQPNHFVTAVLYLPQGRAPYPAVLFPCGHSNNGKAEEAYQRGCILLAKNGFAVLCYDPIDQGERYQLLKPDNTPLIGGTIGHNMTGVGSILVGRNTATYRVWDGMRSIDYLVSRDDIDPNRIGCTGNSGGGTLTSYIMALDERIACAAPSCYITTLRNQAPQDAEQDIHGQIAFGMDHADYIMMRAPRPTLMCTATRDFFDIKGAWYAFRQAKRFYSRMGFAERMSLVETDMTHGFSTQLRQGMTRWMLRWLRGIDTPITEPEFPILTDQQMQCSEDGQVMLMEGARSVYDLNLEREEKLAQQRKSFWADNPADKALDKIREMAGIKALGEFNADVEIDERQKWNDFYVSKIIIKPEAGIVLPALFFTTGSDNASKEVVLYLNDKGKDTELEDIKGYLNEGKNVFAVDLRGVGETVRQSDGKGYNLHFGVEWQAYFSAYMLDKTYVGMRTDDILTCAQYIQMLSGNKPCQIHLVACGEVGPPALHAAALKHNMFASVKIKNSLISWSNVIHNTMNRNQLINTVHGALKFYDLLDLAALIPEEKLSIENPVDALGEPIAE
jgi:cephalosporin-C deacetylase-like acetyl esterase